MGLLEVENLTYYYPEKEHPSLLNVNLSIEEGEFIFLAGPSGSGKSTLLRALAGLLPDFYGGRIGGRIIYANRPLKDWDRRLLAREIGMIFQDPEQQLVMTTAEQEIAFGLENLGIPFQEMRRRVAEVLTLFDLNPLRRKSTFNISGGQKQKVVLAAILAMYPRVLLLDEPTSQLDPVAAQEFFGHLQRLNQEWGLTVVLAEQRIERCFPLSDRVVLLEEGKIVREAPTRQFLGNAADKYLLFLPPVARVFAALNRAERPLTVKEGRRLLFALLPGDLQEELTGAKKEKSHLWRKGQPIEAAAAERPPLSGASPSREPVLEIKNLSFAYPKGEPCLRDVNLKLYAGEITVLMGENGAGKSTLLKNINGLLRPTRGKIYFQQRDITGLPAEELALEIGYLGQDPNDYLFNDTVLEEISFNLKVRGREEKNRVEEVINLLGLKGFEEVNPRDLSGGERQRVALGTVLAMNPAVLLLDEPTRGLDTHLKGQLGRILGRLQDEGKSILMVTHDVELAAEVAQRVIVISHGEIIAEGSRAEILCNSLYYTSQINRLFRGLGPSKLNVEEAVKWLQKSCEKKGRTG